MRTINLYDEQDGITIHVTEDGDIVDELAPGEHGVRIVGHRMYPCSLDKAQCLIRNEYLARQLMTQAQQIAELFGNDGQVWETADGQNLDDACEAAHGVKTYRTNTGGWGTDTYKYEFADGSVIMIAGAAWDFGYRDCWCWGGLGHDPETCELEQRFTPTHKIVVTSFDGEIDETLVQLDSEGAAYTEEEWGAEVYSDWTYDEQDGWLFHGRPGPTDSCTVEVVAIKQ